MDRDWIVSEVGKNQHRWRLPLEVAHPKESDVPPATDLGLDRVSELYLQAQAGGERRFYVGGTDPQNPELLSDEIEEGYRSIWLKNQTTGSFIRLELAGSADNPEYLMTVDPNPGTPQFESISIFNHTTKVYMVMTIEGTDQNPQLIYTPEEE
jgi:hypothetical protein